MEKGEVTAASPSSQHVKVDSKRAALQPLKQTLQIYILTKSASLSFMAGCDGLTITMARRCPELICLQRAAHSCRDLEVGCSTLSR